MERSLGWDEALGRGREREQLESRGLEQAMGA